MSENSDIQVIKKVEVQVRGKNAMIYLKRQMLDSIFKISMPERRVLWYLLKGYKHNDLSTIQLDATINHREYAALFEITNNQASIEIRKACDAFPDNVIFIPKPEWLGNIISDLDEQILSREELEALSPFAKVNFAETSAFGIRKGESEIIFTRTFLSLLLPVKGDYFTQYRLLAINKAVNSTFVDFYEILRTFLNLGEYDITPNRLINKLLLPATYSSFTQLRRGFLVPAIKKINKITDLIVEVKEFREEREGVKPKNLKVIKLKFKIRLKTEVELTAAGIPLVVLEDAKKVKINQKKLMQSIS